MPKKIANTVKLGAFVLGGLLFLVLLLYMIGKNKNMFGSTYTLKARFDNVQGLVTGNNVRYSGIEVGTVKKINFLNDTVIEVSMIIDKDMQDIIRKNAIASIGTEGFVGNKVVNIAPGRTPSTIAVPGDILMTKVTFEPEAMLQTLHKTNEDISIIASNLKETVTRLNNSRAFWKLLNDEGIPRDLRASADDFRHAAKNAARLLVNLNKLADDMRMGNGIISTLIYDSLSAENLASSIGKITVIEDRIDSVVREVNLAVKDIRSDIESGKGALHTIFKDSLVAADLDSTIESLKLGAEAFNQNMEALKQNFLFRGYFRRLEKQQKKHSPPANLNKSH
jgi:phospholipid/cholesterol/gamma-HCH transport system substrate-binding protein